MQSPSPTQNAQKLMSMGETLQHYHLRFLCASTGVSFSFYLGCKPKHRKEKKKKKKQYLIKWSSSGKLIYTLLWENGKYAKRSSKKTELWITCLSPFFPSSLLSLFLSRWSWGLWLHIRRSFFSFLTYVVVSRLCICSHDWFPLCKLIWIFSVRKKENIFHIFELIVIHCLLFLTHWAMPIFFISVSSHSDS